MEKDLQITKFTAKRKCSTWMLKCNCVILRWIKKKRSQIDD